MNWKNSKRIEELESDKTMLQNQILEINPLVSDVH